MSQEQEQEQSQEQKKQEKQKKQPQEQSQAKDVKVDKAMPQLVPALTKEQATPIRMPPEVWGPIFWRTLHIASLAYTDKPTERQKRNMKNFYESMVDVIPCPICRHHYEQNLKELPIDEALNSHMGLIVWVWTMHNKINVQLEKREFTFDEFIESMQMLGADAKQKKPSSSSGTDRCSSSMSFVDGILLGAGVSLVGYYLYQEGIRRLTK